MFPMAGPLSSEEIEDVVSSVRRLVSNEQSAHRMTRDLTAERLVLTPALRVVSEIGPLSPLILEGRLADPGPVAVPLVPEIAEVADVVENDTNNDVIDADWEEELWTASETAGLGEVALGAEEAQVVTLGDDAAVVTTGAALEDGPEPWDQLGSDWAEDEPIPFIPLRRRAENLAARLAAGEVVETSSTPEPAPFGAGQGIVEDVVAADDALFAESTDDFATTEPDFAATGQRQADDETPVRMTQRMPTEILDADGTPLAVLDESALQEIVRQMIREELQGSLGERITRNVRKLVRAEINRALVARDLD
jgi:cell pole-organizing protein PopZ